MAVEDGGGGGGGGGGGESSETSPTCRVKLFCSHGGRILPRPSDGTLKYVGGETRVIAVPRSITFSDLMKKINDLFDGEYVLKYQIALEDLDSLVSVKSDEDIRHLLDEYDRLEREGNSKLRTFLFPIKPIESHTPLSTLGPHALEQRFVDAVNGIVRPINFSSKLPVNTTRLRSFSPSPTEGSSPQSLSPRSITHNTSVNQENSLVSSLHSRLARLHKVQSSPSLCNLANSSIQQQPSCHYSPIQQYQHYNHGYQSPRILPQDRHIITHHGYQSPTPHDHHISATRSSQFPPRDHHVSSEYGKVPFGSVVHHNPGYHYPLFKAYPGSGGHSRWGHLEQYATDAYGSSQFG